MPRPLVLALLLAGLPAQERANFEPVRLPVLGPLPADAGSVRVERDGMLRGDLDGMLAKKPGSIVLDVDRRTPAAVVGAVVERCRAAGVERVLFRAVLPGKGEAGVFTLALPESRIAGTELELHLHRDGPGVPPDSAGPHLRRMVEGLAKAEQPPLQLLVAVPGDGEAEAALQVLAAVARADVPFVVVQWRRTKAQARVAGSSPGDLSALARAQESRAGTLALTLGPKPVLHVPAVAVPLPRPEVRDGEVGILGRAQSRRVPEGRGGAGGRYGGRAGGAMHPTLLAVHEAVAAGQAWLARMQQPEGAWRDDAGEPDVEATAVALLTFLGDGQTLDVGPQAEVLCRGVGWLMAQQGEDGRIGPPGAGAVRRHARATATLAEASGLSGSGAYLRGHLQDAIRWLEAQRLPDGGWNDGTPGAPADTLSTTFCHMALMSSSYFRLEVGADGANLAKWFDEVADARNGAHVLRPGESAGEVAAITYTCTAGALFGRIFDGQDPKTMPVLYRAADTLRSVGADHGAVADPLRCYFTTYAFYQVGGAYWAGWHGVLDTELLPEQEEKGRDAGSWPVPEGQDYSRVMTTALRILTLQAYYRYTRLVR